MRGGDSVPQAWELAWKLLGQTEPPSFGVGYGFRSEFYPICCKKKINICEVSGRTFNFNYVIIAVSQDSASLLCT